MFISFKRIGVAVVLGICAVSMSGVMAQQPPARSTLRAITYEGDMTNVLSALPGAYGVTVGLELDSQRYRHVGIALSDATLTDVMNAIVQAAKKYQWRQTGEVVEVWPVAGGNPLLETRINNFNVKNVSALEAFNRLFTLPEVLANMRELNLQRRAPDESPDKLISSRFSVNLEGVTLREALNKIAQESHIEIWIFRNYPNGFFSITSVDR
jgi:hypothetical protein